MTVDPQFLSPEEAPLRYPDRPQVIRNMPDGLIVIETPDGQDNVYTAWEPAEGVSHTVFRKFGDRKYGRIGTRVLPATIRSLPVGSGSRKFAVHRFTSADEARAYEAIVMAFPTAASGHRVVGVIRTTGLPPVQTDPVPE